MELNPETGDKAVGYVSLFVAGFLFAMFVFGV